MKSSEVDFKFPVLGFTPDGDIWGFPDADRPVPDPDATENAPRSGVRWRRALLCV
jgi:hypothetical protein